MPEAHLKLTVEYDGTDFHGWQSQPGCRTVEGCLAAALAGLAGGPFELAGASRTDRGVHASGQVASFHGPMPVPSSRLASVLVGRLPGDVRVRRVEEVDPGFHARFSAVGKHYRYLIDRREVPGVFLSRHAWHHALPLHLESMQEAARLFAGEHDFAAFQCVSDQPARTTIRRVHRVRVEEVEDVLVADVWGSSFLYKMVRTMVGTLVEIGRGRWPPGLITESFLHRDRRRVGRTAPGHGLCLIEVFHDLQGLEDGLRGALAPTASARGLLEPPTRLT